MKLSLACSLLILVLGGALGWMNHVQTGTLIREEIRLREEVSQLGIGADASTIKRLRPAVGKSPQAVAAGIIALLKELETSKAAQPENASNDARSRELMAQLVGLDAAQLKALIASLRGDDSLSDDARRDLVEFSILLLSEEHPAQALALFEDAGEMLDASPMRSYCLSSTLANWAKIDPLAALAWLEKKSKDQPDSVDDIMRQSIIGGLAEKDPRRAFSLIGQAGIDDSAGLQTIIDSGKTPEQRTAILAALRGHLAKLPAGEVRDDLQAEALEMIGRNLPGDRFEDTEKWISNAKLTMEEAAQFAGGLSYFNTQQDTGKWIDWMATHLPKEALAENVDGLIGQWTQQDYLAAGKWLTAAASGPAKDAAVNTYATTVAEYEPQTAIQWAMTLPAGEARQKTLQGIYENWLPKDQIGADAFAKANGLKKWK